MQINRSIHNKMQIYPTILLCSAFIALAPLGVSIAFPTGQSPPPADPPAIQGLEAIEARIFNGMPNKITLQVSRTMYAKRVSLEATFFDTLEQQGTSTRKISVSYWPTAMAMASETELYVAGYNQRYFTIIEKWTLSGPPLVQLGVDPATGQSLFLSIDAPTVTAKEVVFLDNNPAKRHVVAMSLGWGGDSLAVVFDGGRSLSRIPLDTPVAQPITLATSGPASPPVLQAPSLSGPVRDLTVRKHSTYGVVATCGLMPSAGLSQAGVFFDQDEDGFFEQSLIMNSQDWEAYGLSDGSLYLD